VSGSIRPEQLQNNKVRFNWFPQGFSDLKTKYFIQVRKNEVIDSYYLSNGTSHLISKNQLPDPPFQWSVVAIPDILFEKNNSKKVISMISSKVDEVAQWYDVPYYSSDYLFGITLRDTGSLDELTFIYPSSIAFSDKPDLFAVSSGDSGEIIVIREKIFKRYRFENKLGMPAKISNLHYLGDGRFVFTDNRTHTINIFSVETGKATFLSRVQSKLFGDDILKQYVKDVSGRISDEVKTEIHKVKNNYTSFNENEPVEIFGAMTHSKDGSFLVMSPGYKKHKRSWYSYGLANKIYKPTDKRQLASWLKFPQCQYSVKHKKAVNKLPLQVMGVGCLYELQPV
jgi:hypothetical protein